MVFCAPPPPWVINGITVLPLRLLSAKKLLTAGAIVPHQFGEPIKIISYWEIFSTFPFNVG